MLCGIIGEPRHAYAVLQLLTVPGRVYACLGRPSQRPYRVSLFNRSATMTCGIYCITNTKNKKRYIGSAVNIAARWKMHRGDLRRGEHHSGHLQAAWKKYGEAVFRFEIVTTCEPEQLLEQEQFWIDAFQTADDRYGYNIAPKAGSSLGIKRRPETRAKVSAANLGRKDSPEVRAKKSASHVGTKHSDETRAKMSISLIAANARPEVKAKIAAALRGIKRSDETRAKVAAATKEAMARPEVRAKVAGANLGRKHSPETLAKMSAVQQERQSRPEVRAKIAATAREVFARPEVKAKLSEARAGRRPYAKLTERDVRRIRQLLVDGVTQAEIARMFDVSCHCIYSIKIGRTWSSVK